MNRQIVSVTPVAPGWGAWTHVSHATQTPLPPPSHSPGTTVKLYLSFLPGVRSSLPAVSIPSCGAECHPFFLWKRGVAFRLFIQLAYLNVALTRRKIICKNPYKICKPPLMHREIVALRSRPSGIIMTRSLGHPRSRGECKSRADALMHSRFCLSAECEGSDKGRAYMVSLARLVWNRNCLPARVVIMREKTKGKN